MNLSKLSPILLMLSFIVSSSFSQTPASKIHADVQGAIQAERLIQELFDKEKLPGMAVEVWKNGKSVFSKGYGYANVANRIPVDPNLSKFRIGSISKPFTAVALGSLYESGKLDLDASIQTYVPQFPKKKHRVSLRQLAGHMGGIRHYSGNEFMNNTHYATVQEGLSIFTDDPLINIPGTKYSYSSYGWNLISAAIETASEHEFLSFMDQEVFDRIGMENTEADYANREVENRVTFYDKNSLGSITEANPVDNSYKWAGGGFLSTVTDLAKFAQANLDASILQSETIALFTTSQFTKDGDKINYGIGWRSGEDKKGRAWYGHGGGSVGGSSMLLIFPAEHLIVVTTVNLGNAKTGNIAFRVADQFFEK
ncbi:MAG: serine beta-lactamase-like protein LACTB [Saprospiraceae bacterium]|jgi:serine beta-lactamase-like protein LACTB